MPILPPHAFRRAGSGAGLALLLLACHGGGGGSPAPQPDFGITVTPAALSIPAGGSGYVTVTATRSHGFQGALALALGGAPAGILATGTLDTTATSARVAIFIAAEVAPQTLSAATFAAQGGGLTRSVPFALTVAPPLPLGALSPERVQAAGGRQAAANIENHAVVGEPLTAAQSQDATGSTQVRHGFKPTGSPQNP